MKKTIKIVSALDTCLTLYAVANESARIYEIWEPEPAPNPGLEGVTAMRY
jgi:hypothetical protein